MLSSRLQRTARIPLLRPLRPPNLLIHRRPFTQNSQLLLLTSHNPRPQIPYLSQPGFARTPGPSQQLARLLSTENKRFYREQFILATRWTLIGWTFAVLFASIYIGITIEKDERERPTPPEWRFFTRQRLRGARADMAAVERQIAASVDWAKVGSQLRDCLDRLEDPTKEGKGLMEPADGEEILIPDVGKAGFDISGKSYEWRTGYFDVMMGCATAAEHLDGMVLDKTRDIVFPADVVLGPSNPDPRPVTPNMAAAPREENCEAAYDPPESFYMRILTGKGFTTKQRMDAALGYANWLEYKGLAESATEMYRWNIDIAASALAIPADAVFDSKTYVIKEESSGEATQNLLHAATSIAIHHARTGNVSSALPILLSVLRARRSAPISPFPPDLPTSPSASSTQHSQTDIGAAVSMLKRLFATPAFPPPPPSGDLPLIRSSEKPTCEESELMLYIGEILFATAPDSKEGIAWTRQGVTIAEANLAPTRKGDTMQGAGEAKKCRECLLTGVGNWEVMLRNLAAAQAEVKGREGSRSAGWFEFGGWFGRTSGGFGSAGATKGKGEVLDEVAEGVVEAELAQVEGLKERIVREGLDREMQRAKGGGGTVFLSG